MCALLFENENEFWRWEADGMREECTFSTAQREKG